MRRLCKRGHLYEKVVQERTFILEGCAREDIYIRRFDALKVRSNTSSQRVVFDRLPNRIKFNIRHSLYFILFSSAQLS